MGSTTLFDVFREIALPFITLVGGWFAHLIRSKQRKEADILENVNQILILQKAYIAEQDEENRKTRDINKRLEAKLDNKNKSIRKANWCKFTNDGDGCPVLNQEEKNDSADRCDTCKFNSNDNSQA